MRVVQKTRSLEEVLKFDCGIPVGVDTPVLLGDANAAVVRLPARGKPRMMLRTRLFGSYRGFAEYKVDGDDLLPLGVVVSSARVGELHRLLEKTDLRIVKS